MGSPLIALLLLAAPTSSTVEAGAFSAAPLSLQTGMSAGPILELSHSIGPWLLGGRFRLGLLSENDLSFQVSHLELRPELFGGAVWRLGRGELRLAVGLGPAFVHESKTRLQADRLPDANGSSADAWGAGVLASAELGLRVFFYESFSLGVLGGPNFFVSDGDDPFRVGWAGCLLFGYSRAGGDLP